MSYDPQDPGPHIFEKGPSLNKKETTVGDFEPNRDGVFVEVKPPSFFARHWGKITAATAALLSPFFLTLYAAIPIVLGTAAGIATKAKLDPVRNRKHGMLRKAFNGLVVGVSFTVATVAAFHGAIMKNNDANGPTKQEYKNITDAAEEAAKKGGIHFEYPLKNGEVATCNGGVSADGKGQVDCVYPNAFQILKPEIAEWIGLPSSDSYRGFSFPLHSATVTAHYPAAGKPHAAMTAPVKVIKATGGKKRTQLGNALAALRK